MQRGQWFEGPEWLLTEEWPKQLQLVKLKALAKNTGQKGKKRFIQPRRTMMSATRSLPEANSGEPSE